MLDFILFVVGSAIYFRVVHGVALFRALQAAARYYATAYLSVYLGGFAFGFVLALMNAGDLLPLLIVPLIVIDLFVFAWWWKAFEWRIYLMSTSSFSSEEFRRHYDRLFRNLKTETSCPSVYMDRIRPQLSPISYDVAQIRRDCETFLRNRGIRFNLGEDEEFFHERLLSLYCSPHIYKELNDEMRKKVMSTEYESLVVGLCKALSNNRGDSQDIPLVYRGTGRKKLNVTVGQYLYLPSFTSTSKDVEVAKKYGEDSYIQIELTAGCIFTDMHTLSQFPDEREVLLAPYQKFRVKSTNPHIVLTCLGPAVG